jgi:uncharacterized protein (TIGR00730 family)
VFADAARRLAEVLYEQRLELVFGGSSKGLMGVLADRLLALGGTAVGVIPQSLVDKEVAHDGLTELHVVQSMHARKAMIGDLSDAFVAMPGGTGTLEEIIESLTWAQLRFHDKPCGLLNVGGYYNGLLQFLDHATAEEFLRPAHRSMLQVDDDPLSLLEKFRSYVPPDIRKWL